jgi:hypothetical protein
MQAKRIMKRSVAALKKGRANSKNIDLFASTSSNHTSRTIMTAASHEPVPRSILTIKTQEDSVSTTIKSKKANKASVTFGNVEVRSHEIILGDNPAVSEGPPVTIDWEPFGYAGCTVEKYEEGRKSCIRSYFEMKMPAPTRFDILSRTTSTTMITKRSRETVQVKKQRLETRSQLYKAENEEKVERLVRGFRNLVTNRKKKERKYLEDSMHAISSSISSF